MHKEPPLNNPASQCMTQTAISPHLCPLLFPGRLEDTKKTKNKKKGFLPANPHLSASSIRGCARKTGHKTTAANAEKSGGGWGWGGVSPRHPSLARPTSPFFCRLLAAENMQTCGLGTLLMHAVDLCPTTVTNSVGVQALALSCVTWRVHLEGACRY